MSMHTGKLPGNLPSTSNQPDLKNYEPFFLTTSYFSAIWRWDTDLPAIAAKVTVIAFPLFLLLLAFTLICDLGLAASHYLYGEDTAIVGPPHVNLTGLEKEIQQPCNNDTGFTEVRSRRKPTGSTRSVTLEPRAAAYAPTGNRFGALSSSNDEDA